MAKLLLDEMFFVRNNIDGYIDEVIYFICKYFKDDIVFFHPYCNPNNLWMLKNEMASIEKKVMKSGKVYICDWNLINSYDLQKNICFDKCSKQFTKEISYLCNTFEDVIIFNAPENHNIKENHPYEHIYFVNHIKKEIDSNIAYFISNGLFMINIIDPKANSPLPNIELCDEYKSIQDELIKGKDTFSRIPIFLLICKEVLQRNVYTYNGFLSSINTTKKKIREIYQNKDSTIYGSIDVDTGSIEICDHNGHHIDEFGFDNQKHNKHDPTGKHDIKLHK